MIRRGARVTRAMLAALAALLLVVGLAPLAGADPQSRPNGPWVQEAEKLNLEGFRSYEQLVAELHRIEDSSRGRVELEVIGTSNEGRDIYLARVGSGERSVLYLTQQHGNEPHGTEAAVQALRTLGSSNHPAVRRIRDELTVLMVVRANPDGSERYWRQNVDPDCDATLASCLPGRGYDPNRWHDPRVADEDVPVPEALAIRETFRRFTPELVVDYHGQLSYVSGDGRMITTSVLWPMFPADVDVTPERDAAVRYSKQVSALIYDTLQPLGHAEVTQYPPGTTMGTARVAYGFLGSASILFEQRADAGQKSIGMLVRQAYITMLDIAEAVADGSVFDIDPDRADELPPRGPRVTNPNAGRHVDTCPRVGPAGDGPVLEQEGSLYDYVLAYEAERILPQGSNAYVRPTDEEACTMAAAFERLQAGDLAAAAGLAAPFGYDVVRFTDTGTGRMHVLLAERLDGERVFRGWGLYVHTPDSETSITLQAAFPQSATFSERLAAQAYDAIHARNLFVAGAHRGANDADELGTEPANVTQDDGSVFHRIHQAVTRGPGDSTIQTLGATGAAREVVVTAGVAPPTELAEQLAAGLSANAYDVCLFGDGTCTRLPSTLNGQGQFSRAVGADWVALYPSFGIRGLLVNRQELADVLANLLAH
jgi:hypothetical protein